MLIGLMCFGNLVSCMAATEATSGQYTVDLVVDVQPRDGMDIPEFKVSIKNVSGEAVSVIDVRNNLTSQQLYAPLQVVSVDPLIGIMSDRLGDLGYSDVKYVVLPPGGSFEYVAAPGFDLSQLVQGKYRAQVLYYPDREDDRITYASPVVEFEILEGSPPSAARRREPFVEGVWSTRCVRSGDPRFCVIYFQPLGSGSGLPQSWFLSISWLPAFNVSVYQFPTCNLNPVVLTVDNNEPMELTWNSVYELTGNNAKSAVAQFVSGNKLFLNVGLTKDCIRQEVEIPLADFSVIWREIAAKTPQ